MWWCNLSSITQVTWKGILLKEKVSVFLAKHVWAYKCKWESQFIQKQQNIYALLMCTCIKAYYRPIFNVDSLGTMIPWSWVLCYTKITEFYEVNLHRSFPKQSVEYFSFSCCKCILLSFFIFLKLFCKYSVYIRKFCSVKTVCVWRNGSHYTLSCGKTKVTWLFAVDSVEAVFSLGHGLARKTEMAL